MLWIWTSTKNLWMIIVVISGLVYCLLKFFQYWYLAFGEFQEYYIFIELCYFIFVKLCYFEFGLKCKELISRWMLYFCWTILFWMWVENLKWMHCFLGWKKIISRWMLYLILCRLKWVVLHLCQPSTTHLLSVSNGLGQVNPPY